MHPRTVMIEVVYTTSTALFCLVSSKQRILLGHRGHARHAVLGHDLGQLLNLLAQSVVYGLLDECLDAVRVLLDDVRVDANLVEHRDKILRLFEPRRHQIVAS